MYNIGGKKTTFHRFFPIFGVGLTKILRFPEDVSRVKIN